MKIEALKVNAFTEKIDGGNPAGIVINPPNLSVKQMCEVSKILNVSETAFVFPSKKYDYKVRFFSPSVEVDLCGHATIACFFTIAEKGLISKEKVFQETKAGVLPVDIDLDETGSVRKVMMTQSKPIYKDIFLDISNLADLLNIKWDYIDDSLPFQSVSTGLFTFPVCIKNFKILKSIDPDFKRVKEFCKINNIGSLHLFTFDTLEKDSFYHARNFAPIYGINEDPITGTANGAVCSYLVKNGITDDSKFICEQGDIIGRSGRINVELKKDLVRVGGRSKFVEKKILDI